MNSTTTTTTTTLSHSHGPLVALRCIDRRKPIQSFIKMAQECGPFFAVRMPDRRMIVISDPTIVRELCHPKRFQKRVSRPLLQLRDMAGDGLFTALQSEPNWGRAHRIARPAFTPSALRTYHPAMLDVALQMGDKWTRRNSGEQVDVVADCTRLTLETIGLCAFSYRFHGFEREQPHPFVTALTEVLSESMAQTFRFPWEINPWRSARHRRNLLFLAEVVDSVISDRRRSGERRNDLLDRLLWHPDPDTGERLSDENVRFQVLTFLVAGHETTSGLSAFCLRALALHPEVLRKATAEVDKLDREPTYEQIGDCRYLKSVVSETLRLWPTAPAFSLQPLQETELSGIPVYPDDDLMVLLPMLHRNPDMWEQPDVFRPERFLDGSVPPCAFRPFGNGKRGCIGRAFALHEAILCLAVLLQRVELGELEKALEIEESFTLKPAAFQLQPTARV